MTALNNFRPNFSNLRPEVKEAGFRQAERSHLKSCPECLSKMVVMFAGDGMYDYDIYCLMCEHHVHGSRLVQAIRIWNTDEDGKRNRNFDKLQKGENEDA